MGIDRGTPIYVCDLSGLAAPGIEEELALEEDDPMGDAPEGWTQLVVRTRLVNPDWVQAQQVYAQAIAAVKEEMKDEQDKNRLRAALFALNQQFLPILDTPQFLVNESSLWVHPQFIDELMNRLDPETAELHREAADLISMEDDLDDEFEDEPEEELVAHEEPQAEAEPEGSPKPKSKRTGKKTPAKAGAEAK